MELAEMLAALPRGREDKPLLLPVDDLVFDPYNIDGRWFDMDPEASGCVILLFSKPMNPDIPGRAYVNGQPVLKCAIKSMPQLMGLWAAGIWIRDYVTNHGSSYSLRVEGFIDADGNEMNPQEFTITTPPAQAPLPKYRAHEQLALRAAREGIVLLKNDGVLPLAHGTVLNLFGRGIHRFRTSAAGAGEINPRYRVNFLEAIADDEHFTLNRELTDFYRCDEDLIPDDELLKRAKALSDTAVMLISRSARENRDSSSAKGSFYLTDEEESLIRDLRETFSRLIVILNVGHPIDVRFAERYRVDALLYNGYGGMLAGQALCDVLSGRENPSGRLPDTWAMDYFDIPSSRNFYDSKDKPVLHTDSPVYVDTVYEEGIYVGYRYFSTFGVKAAYPFGCGLSYTDFSISAGKPRFDSCLRLDIVVTNTGSLPGKESVQVYVRKPGTLCETPERELCWIAKTKVLEPGESQAFAVSVEPEELAVFDVCRAAWVMPAGEYLAYAGSSSTAPLCGTFFAEELVVQQVSHRMLAPEPPAELSRYDGESFPKGKRSGLKEEKGFTPPRKSPKYAMTLPDETIETLVGKLPVPALARLSVCSGWSVGLEGSAGCLCKPEGIDLPDFIVSDGNSGVNLKSPNIGFPSGATLAASFDPELLEEVGRVIGEEAKELGVQMILAPGMNLHRNPLNGRQAEYFSEDPYLAGTVAGHYCRGLESAGVAGCLKHLAANNCETSRKRNQSIIGERALRELYLRPFRIAMRIHMPAAVMTAYNALNGCPTAADEELLQGFLREENGFDGFVMTDWDSYDTVSVPEAVDAGNSWMTPGTLDDTYVNPIVEGVARGTIRLERLRENVAYLLKTISRFSETGGHQ